MRTSIIILLAMATLCTAQGSPPDSVKGDTVFVHTIQIDDGRVAVERNAYDEALKATNKTIDSLKWMIGIIFVAAGAILGFIKWRQEIRTRNAVKSFEKKLIEAEERVDKVKKEHEESAKKLREQCDEGNGVISDIKIYKAKLVEDKKEYDELEEKTRGLISNIEEKIAEEVSKGIEAIKATVEEAKAEAKTAIEKSDKADVKADKAMALSRVFQAYERAFDLQKEENHKNAILGYDKAIEEYEKSELDEKDLLAEMLVNRGSAKDDLKDYDGAIADYDRAIELKPDLAEAFYNRGNAKKKLEDYEGAIADYDRAIELKPDFANAFVNRGNAKDDLERYEEAIADYDRAIELKPDLAEAFYNRGIAKRKLERYDDAIADYDRAIELKPDDAEAFNNRGIAKDDLERYEEAIADYDRAIELKPDYAEAFYNRGNAKRKLERYDDAIADYDRAIELKKDLANAFYNRGLTKHDLKDYDGAIADYDRAIELKPDLAEAFNNRANAYIFLARFQCIEPGDHELFRKAKAEALMAEELKKGEGLYNLACAEALLLEKDEAFKHLELALEKDLISLEHVKKDEDWEHLREEPEYQRIIARFENDQSGGEGE